MCRQPALPNDKLQLLKAQIADSIDHKNDSKDAIAARTVKRLLYGADSLYSREATLPGVRSMDRDAAATWLQSRQRARPPLARLLRWIRASLALLASRAQVITSCARMPERLARHVDSRPLNSSESALCAGPDNARVALIGDVSRAVVMQQLEKNLGGWQVAPSQPAAPPAVPRDRDPTAAAGHSVYLIDRPGLQQAVVMLAEPGIQQRDPDTFALDVLGSTLNGLGGARLVP